tara:strand:- start:2477 stop:3478 length:1002 start_codon:yes stop_codon:yes gene_type:complete
MKERETFIAITGCSHDEVDQWFQLGDNDLDRSVELYYNMNNIDTTDVSNIVQENQKTDLDHDDKIRKPDKIKRQKLLESDDEYEMENTVESVFGENINPTTDHIRFQGDFDSAKKFSKKNKKLLIVNLQMEDNLNSMNLNRIIWKDELVTSIIKEKYIFLQYYYKNKICQQISSFYNIYEFPSIFIINPLTGSLIWKSLTTEILKADLLSVISGFNFEAEDIFKSLEQLSCKSILNQDVELPVIIDNDSIIINAVLNGKRLEIVTSIEYDLKQFALQIASILNQNDSNIDKFDVLWDFPQKHLISEIKNNLNELPKLKDYDYKKFRFNIRLTS